MPRRCSLQKKAEVRLTACLVMCQIIAGHQYQSSACWILTVLPALRAVLTCRQLILIHILKVLVTREARAHAPAGDWYGLQRAWRRGWSEYTLGKSDC